VQRQCRWISGIQLALAGASARGQVAGSSTHCELPAARRELQRRSVMISWLANRYRQEGGAIGYIILWALGVPASLLFVIFLLRGCN
jgi:hypothetical protein